MRLEDLKLALIEQFFKNSKNGVDKDKISEVLVSLRCNIKNNKEQTADDVLFLERVGPTSSDPTKAFALFIKGRESTLSIMEEDGIKVRSIFAAARIGKDIYFANLTESPFIQKKGNLAAIKQALRQAKNINDEVYFSIVHDGEKKL